MASQAAIARIRAELSALKLELLVPNKNLTDEQIEAIMWARKHPSGKKFRGQLPLVVARFMNAAKKEIMERARKHSGVIRPKVYRRLYRADIEKINYVLFDQPGVKFAWGIYGRFKYKVERIIHADTATRSNFYPDFPYAPVYGVRLGGLPIQFISGETEFKLSKKIMQRINLQQGTDESTVEDKKAEKFRQKLCNDDILKPARLGNVCLYLGGGEDKPNGTKHCSSYVSKRGRYSAIFVCRGRFFAANHAFR